MFFIALSTMLSLFLCMGVGYIGAKKKIISDDSINHLNNLLINVTMPFMFLDILNIKLTPELMLIAPKSILSGFLYIFILYFITIFIFKFFRVKSSKEGIYIYSLIFTNVGFIGIPLVTNVLDKSSVVFTALLNIPFNMLAFILAFWILNPNKDEKIDYKQIFLSPVIIAMFIGLMLLFSQLIIPFSFGDNRLPYFMSYSISLIGGITSPLAMIIVGASLEHVKFKKIFTNLKLHIFSILSLIITPLIIFFILNTLSNDLQIINICTLMTALPSAMISVVLAKNFGLDYVLASEIVFMSTLYSIITIPIFIFLLF